MGLFSAPRRFFRASEFRSPIRLHSEFSLGALSGRIAGSLGQVRQLAVAATNDARVVGAVLVVAATLLAAEMTRSILHP